jgi:hypothetical protein
VLAIAGKDDLKGRKGEREGASFNELMVEKWVDVTKSSTIIGPNGPFDDLSRCVSAIRDLTDKEH